MRRTLLTISLSLALSLLAAWPASAQQVKLSFNDGLVSLDVAAVPVRTILAEWSKLGGTKVIGGERVTGAPLTLKLVNVPESQALEIVLRSVAGYMAAPRSASAAGSSMYDRILVLATSSAPAPAAGRPAPPQPTNQPNNGRFVRPQPAQSDEQDEPEDDPDPNPPNPPAFTFPPPGQAGGYAQPGMLSNPPPGIGQPTITINPNTGAPQSITINPSTPSSRPGTTFGTPTPGMITAPPPQQQQPGTPVRPPGGA
jgi:hypothetical protein